MSRTDRDVARLRALARDFARPWLEGGVARVEGPAGAGALGAWRAFEHALDDDVAEALAHAVTSAGRALAGGAAVPWPDRGAIGLLLAVHDLVALTDPTLARWPARRARDRLAAFPLELAAAVGAPRTRGEALARHAVVARLHHAAREDVVVRTWAARHRYEGRPVPARVVALPRLRAVRVEPDLRPLVDVVRDTVIGPFRAGALALAELHRASPITRLLHGDPGEGALEASELAVLADTRLRGAVARALLRGPAGARRALGERLDRPVPLAPEAWSLVFELGAAAALDAGAAAGASLGSPLLDALFARGLEAAGPLAVELHALAPGDREAVRRHARALEGAVDLATRARATALLDPPAPAPTPPPLEVRA